MLIPISIRCLLALLLIAPMALHAASLRIGTSGQYPPFSQDHQGELEGLDIELAQQLATFLGQEIEFRVLPFSDLIPALRNDSIDLIMSGMSITPARSRQVLFTSPITQTGQVAIIHQRNIGMLGEPWQLTRDGRRIGVKRGTTGEELVLNEFPSAIVMSFDTIDKALAVLTAGELDYVIHDAQTSWMISQNREFEELISLNQPLSEESIAWAVSPKSRELLLQINAFLTEARRNGELDRLLRRWLPLSIYTNQAPRH
ncbi:substrate-binding periplasmic protein [Aestuariirhabdus sp. LZHN29]|uniref:substrate-binding periplasmic protein n=1 Tax=Aestuariirhabdus sp. LZHN29 TaxID=3417462 RepID=UPI003CFAB9C7